MVVVAVVQQLSKQHLTMVVGMMMLVVKMLIKTAFEQNY
jgi:hypothetical protein